MMTHTMDMMTMTFMEATLLPHLQYHLVAGAEVDLTLPL